MTTDHKVLTEAVVRQRLLDGCQTCGLPRHMWTSLIEYVMIGRPVGEFLEAVLSNDLMEAVKKADDLNAQRLKDYCTWLVSVAPVNCWGSKVVYSSWRRTGGVLGRQQTMDDALLELAKERGPLEVRREGHEE